MPQTRTLIFLLLIGLCLGGVSMLYAFVTHRIPDMAYGKTTHPEKVFVPTEIFFVGDVMLGRRVETLSREYGLSYPFESTTYILADSDITIGNLEGPVPEHHVHTPDLTYQFSFDEQVLPVLKAVGFDVLSLANNHTYDYGKEGFIHTQSTCRDAGLICVGHPQVLSAGSLMYRTVHDVSVGFIMIHATVASIDVSALEMLLEELETGSDVQVAYIHWGDEYVLEHGIAQETLAHHLIEGGIDVVIGHHPHVIQDVALYEGKPIFYSLGNFVFDQYFSDSVQEGLGVHMKIDEDSIVYTLVPFESKTVRSQPRVASIDDTKRLFDRILNHSLGDTRVDAVQGSISVPR